MLMSINLTSQNWMKKEMIWLHLSETNSFNSIKNEMRLNVVIAPRAVVHSTSSAFNVTKSCAGMHAHTKFQTIVNCCKLSCKQKNKTSKFISSYFKRIQCHMANIGSPKNGLFGSNFAFIIVFFESLSNTINCCRPIASVCSRTQSIFSTQISFYFCINWNESATPSIE